MRPPFTHLVLSVLIGVLASGGYYWWHIIIANKSSEVVSLQDQIAILKQQSSQVSAAQTAFADVSGDEAKIQNYFVSEDNVVSFINVLQNDGLTQGTTLNVLSVSKGTSLDQPTLLFSLSISGAFDAVMRTVGLIEYSPYALSVSMFSIHKGTKKDWQANVGLTVGSILTATTTTNISQP